MEKTFYPINVSPFATNVLDLVGRDDLVTRSGVKVAVSRSSLSFHIRIGGIDYFTGDNLSASYLLNQAEVGVMG